MISLNATLIVQVINFGLAYIILRFLVFQPALNLILSQRRATQELQETIAHKKEKLEQQNIVRDEQWVACRNFFAQNRPPIEHPDRFVFRSITPSIERSSLSTDSVDSLAQQTADVLAAKIGV